MKPTVYLETTFVSYLTAWLSRDLVMAANQALTREWWTDQRDDYELVVSELVLREAAAGDSDAARRRLEVLNTLERIEFDGPSIALAGRIAAELQLGPKVKADAFHIAVSAVHGVDYLLTWNCTHIANATFRLRIEKTCREFGCKAPIICTPQELLRRSSHDS